jgi:tetratricopeptide (TPR) repeat protein
MSSRNGIVVVRHLLILGLLAFAAACAPKAPNLPEPGGVARYPDFMFPEPPGEIGTPVARERHNAGWLWLQAGDLRAAERNFNATLKVEPTFYPAEAGLGYLSLARKDHESAVSHFERAVRANPRYVPALVGRGEAHLALGARDRALESFEAAVAADPDLTGLRSRVEVLRFRGLQDDVAAARKAAEAGRLDEARQAYKRALLASPQSPFLLRELASIERRAGDLPSALQHAQQAAELEPTDVRNLTVLAELYEQQGDLATAMTTYEAAAAVEPGGDIDARIGALREKLALAALPPEFHAIESSPTVSRAQLAALFGIHLEELIKRSVSQNAVVITDSRGNWAVQWIMEVTRSGVMEVYPNHTFQPEATVRRSDLAQAASRILSLIATEKPALAASWRNVRHRFPDVSAGHLAYPAASLAVEAGVMRPLEDGTFQLARAVTGAEAVAAVKKLEELAESPAR